MIEQTDRVRKEGEMDREVNGSLSLHLPLLPVLLNHYQSAVQSVLLLLDSDWGGKMWS